MIPTKNPGNDNPGFPILSRIFRQETMGFVV